MSATPVPVPPAFPARLEGHLQPPSRALWLVKWLLLVPHFVLLAFLWLAFVLLSFVAFFALLFGASYPRRIFGFNVGVLRWTWRVGFYAFAANGTDRYPPFTLADVPDYPARLEIDYPHDQRHGFPLIGWWLAGLPQYLVAGIFAGAGAGVVTWQVSAHASASTWPVGLVDLLVLFAVVALLFRGAYPRSIFDLVLGLNRWVLRVGAYAALMTREYPPFRLDTGELDTAGLATPADAAGVTTGEVGERPERWGAGRVVAVVLGSLLALLAGALLVAGGIAVVFDQTQRNASGYLMTGARAYDTPTYALVSDSYRTGSAGEWIVPRSILGTVRIATQSTTPIFVGIGPARAVDTYLAGVRREVASRPDAGPGNFSISAGGPPPTGPLAQHFWVAQATGKGSQVLSWRPESGNWKIVLMNPLGKPGVSAELSVGARLPHLLAIGSSMLAAGIILALISGGVIYAAARRRTSTG
jgi:hypothetical protein